MQQLAPSPSSRSEFWPHWLISLVEMIEFKPNPLIAATSLMRLVRTWAILTETNRPIAPNALIPKACGTAIEECKELGLIVTKALLEELEKKANGALRNDQLSTLVEAIELALNTELGALKIFRVAPAYSGYLNAGNEVGDDFQMAFPDALGDFEAAGQCIAFGLATAGVFHLMRVIEHGLRDLSAQLGIPYAPSWEAHLVQIASRIQVKHKTKTVGWKRDEAFFRDVTGDLVTIKQAWRNPTMHIVRHYQQHEAAEVFTAVRQFMRRLSKRKVEVASGGRKRKKPS